MVRRQVLLDEQTDRLLDQLAAPLAGNRSLAVREAIKAHISVEAELDRLEKLDSVSLRKQKARSEEEFAHGRIVNWRDLKRRNRL